MKELEKFNGKVAVVKEVIRVDGGSPREYDVIYLGLGAAYFLDTERENAGYGVPGQGSWDFYQRNGLIKEISSFLDIHNNKKPPEYVRLPVEVRQVLNP